MKILLLGANGQLGKAWIDLAQTENFPIGWELITWDREKGDLAHPLLLLSLIEVLKPNAIINAAAYTQVDRAETERELAETINAKTPALLAKYCAQNHIPLIHYSTDYVYGVGTNAPHQEIEAPQPLNFYGQSKAIGDELIAKSGCDHLIFRTSWVFSHTGKNFVRTMLKLGSERPSLKVVDDQVGSPTYAPDLAEYSLQAFMRALEKKTETQTFPSGVYHACNSGETTWCEFAQTILPNVSVSGIPSAQYPTAAERPLNSRLSLKKLETTFGIQPRPWREALNVCLQNLGAHHG